MDSDVTISYNDREEYNILRSFDSEDDEVLCFSHIIDRVLLDISSEKRKSVTIGNIAACLERGTSTWSELKQVFGGYRHTSNVKNKSFTASYKQSVEEGFWGSPSVQLEKEYQPPSPNNLDGKLSVSSTLYTIHLFDDLSSGGLSFLKDILSVQFRYYDENGFPNWTMTDAPAVALESVVR